MKHYLLISLVFLLACSDADNPAKNDATAESTGSAESEIGAQLEGTWTANLSQTLSPTEQINIQFNLTFNEGDLLTESIDSVNGYLTAEDKYEMAGDTIKRYLLEADGSKTWSHEFLVVESMDDTSVILLVVVGEQTNRLRMVRE